MPSLRPCIFCGRFDGLSKEHIWPEWMSSYLPVSQESSSHVSEIHSGVPKQPREIERRSHRPGPVHTKKVRAVCRTCNNTWMSEIEAEAKHIDFAATTALSTWSALKVMVGEHASDQHLTPKQDRASFMQSREIPPYFRVFLARHMGATSAAYFRHSATLSFSRSGPKPQLPAGINRNIQVTTIIVGPLCLYVSAARVDDVPTELLDPVRSMSRIHPCPATVEQTQLPVLSEYDIHLNSLAIERIVRHPQVKYGGPLPSASGQSAA
jgi:hypothetical protein